VALLKAFGDGFSQPNLTRSRLEAVQQPGQAALGPELGGKLLHVSESRWRSDATVSKVTVGLPGAIILAVTLMHQHQHAQTALAQIANPGTELAGALGEHRCLLELTAGQLKLGHLLQDLDIATIDAQGALEQAGGAFERSGLFGLLGLTSQGNDRGIAQAVDLKRTIVGTGCGRTHALGWNTSRCMRTRTRRPTRAAPGQHQRNCGDDKDAHGKPVACKACID